MIELSCQRMQFTNSCPVTINRGFELVKCHLSPRKYHSNIAYLQKRREYIKLSHELQMLVILTKHSCGETQLKYDLWRE